MWKIKTIKQTSIKTVASLLFLLMAQNIYAGAVKNYFEISQSEMRLLPPFCKHGFGRYKIKKKEFMNHLCPGLNALNHAQSIFRNNSTKRYALQEAEQHFSYTLGQVKQFPFRSTVFIKRGAVYEMQGNLQKAMADYQEAIRIKPNNVHAYRALANTYLKTGNKTEAAKLIEKGLKIRPTSKILLYMRKKIKETK